MENPKAEEAAVVERSKESAFPKFMIDVEGFFALFDVLVVALIV